MLLNDVQSCDSPAVSRQHLIVVRLPLSEHESREENFEFIFEKSGMIVQHRVYI